MAPLRAFALSLILLTAVMASAAGAATPLPQTAQALATLITAKGLNCTDFTADTGGGTPPVSEGSCTVGHEADVVLSGNGLVGLALLPNRRAVLTTTSVLFSLDWDIEGLPLPR